MLTELQIITYLVVHLVVGVVTSMWVWKNIQEPVIVASAFKNKHSHSRLVRLRDIQRLQWCMIMMFALWGLLWGIFVLLFRKHITPLHIDFDD